MTEILFKAKRKDNGEWVEGYYYKAECKLGNDTYVYHYIIYQEDNICPSLVARIEVEPATLCQYTGKTDKSGQKIWENDILQVLGLGACKVIWNDKYAMLVLECDGCIFAFDYYCSESLEVIGNIFDNPELLKGDEE